MLYRSQTFLCSVGILHRTKLLTGGRPPGALEPEKWPDWQDCQVAKCDEFRLFLQCSTSNLPFYLFYFNWTWCCNHGRIAHIELATSPSPALTSRLNLFHKLKSKPQYDMVMDMNFGEKNWCTYIRTYISRIAVLNGGRSLALSRSAKRFWNGETGMQKCKSKTEHERK